jgi:AcrR family transcriptional regulator
MIVERAIEIANEEGFAAVSMQRVASDFNFTTMSLYRYVPGKTELVDLMIDTALGTPPALDPALVGWRARMEAWARSMRHVYDQHPWVARTVTDDRLMGPNELGWVEVAVQALAGTPLTGSEMTDAIRVVSSHVRSWAQYSVDMATRTHVLTGEQWGRAIATLISEHKDRYPALSEALISGAFGPAEGTGPEFGLRCVLDGIGVRIQEREREIAERSGRPAGNDAG